MCEYTFYGHYDGIGKPINNHAILLQQAARFSYALNEQLL